MRIKTSRRGLTFSFSETDSMKPGTHYRYFVDLASSEVVIVPDSSGKYRFCQKGKAHKPLVDLRNREVKALLEKALWLEVEVLSDSILVHVKTMPSDYEGSADINLSEVLDYSPEVTVEVPKSLLLERDGGLESLLRESGLLPSVASDVSFVYDVVSLFSGAGLLDLPFKEDRAFDIKFAVDFDSDAVKTYRENIGDHIICMDIRELDESRVPDTDIIIGGPCCQGYSNANRHGSEALNRTKRLLIDDYIRVVKAKQPLVFVIENVPQFLTKENGLYLSRVLSELSDYAVTYSVIDDSQVGGYTVRKRMVLIGSKIGPIKIPAVSVSKPFTCKDALMRVNGAWYNFNDVTIPNIETQRKMAFVKPGHNYKDIPGMKRLNRHSNVYRRAEWDKPVCTLTNWRKVNLMPPEGNRIFTVAEAAALMGLDSSFRVLGSLSAKQQQIGNGVSQAIARFIKNIVKTALDSFLGDSVLTVSRAWSVIRP